MPDARNGDVRIHYELLGAAEAPALLLQRGLGRSKSYWAGIEHRFAERFRVVLMDNRGVGRSDAPRPPYTTKVMADDCAAVLDDAGIERAHYFGISLGGMIGQWLALRHPTRVRRLVLGATTAGIRSRGASKRAALALARCAGMPLEEAIRHTAPWTLGRRYLEECPEVVDDWVEIARSEPSHAAGLVGQFLAGATHDAWSSLDRIEAPTLLVTGDQDRLIPAANSYQLLRRIPRARLRILPGLGHDFPTEAPQETVDLITAFLLER